MKRIFFLFLLTLIKISLFAQGQYRVTGQIKDNTSKKSLEFCSIQISSLTYSTFSTGTVSNSKGFFSIQLHDGR